MIDHVAIPLTALLVSSAFCAVSFAWDEDRRAARAIGGVFLCTGAWAMVDLLAGMEADAEGARFWFRWMYLPPLMIGPATLWVVAQAFDEFDRYRRQVELGAVICAAAGIAIAFVPNAIESVVPSSIGGWSPRFGWPLIVLIPLGLCLPLYSAWIATGAQRNGARESTQHAKSSSNARHDARTDERVRAWAVRACIACSLSITMPTEYLLPILEIDAPRLGSIGVTMATAFFWLSVLHDTEDLIVTPRGLSRSLLAKLHDGVALLQMDGVILSTNQSFAELASCGAGTLTGRRFTALVDAPFESIRGGVENREATLRAEDGTAIPVSISSSLACSGSGDAIGIVLVVRDRREIDRLRGQLLGSGRLAAIGELAAGIAHEVSNPVAFIRSDLNLLGKRLDEVRDRIDASTNPEPGRALIDRTHTRIDAALSGIDRVAEVVVDVREFAHVGGAGQGGSDFESVVEGAMRLARLQRESDVEIMVDSVGGGERIECGQELKQILLALLRVLADDTNKGGRIGAELRTDEEGLSVALVARPVGESTAALQQRLETMSSGAGNKGPGSLGLGVASELVGQLGGDCQVETLAPDAIRIRLSVPSSRDEVAS